MVINILLDDKKDIVKMGEILEETHNSLAGNKDYIDSNIVLSDNFPEEGNITLYLDIDQCKDLEYVRMKAKEMVDRFVDTYKANSEKENK
ncbi:MAG: hypothetical protein PHC62_00975 [Candidatus Izemoplasmatales bacterium]|nr:hypothetical protein [Candidatus Izemoplasmatales bacterium]